MTKEEIKYQWISLPQWQRVLIVLIAVISVLYLFWFFFISPKRERIKTLKAEVNQLQAQVERLRETAKPEKLRKLNEKIIAIKKETEKIKQDIKQLEARIPSKPDFENILLTVSNILSSNDMYIKDLGIKNEKTIYVYKEGDKLVFYEKRKQKKQTQTTKNRKNTKQNQKQKEEIKLKEVPVTVEATGSIRSLKNALEHIAKSERFLSVESISLEKDKQGILSAKINIKTYYIPEKK